MQGNFSIKNNFNDQSTIFSYLENTNNIINKFELEIEIKNIVEHIKEIKFTEENFPLLISIANKNWTVGRDLLYFLIRKDSPVDFFIALLDEKESRFYELLLFFYTKDLEQDEMRIKFKGKSARLLNKLISSKNINHKNLISCMQKLFAFNHKISTGLEFNENLFENENHQMRNLSLLINMHNIFSYRDLFFSRREYEDRKNIFNRLLYNFYLILIRINDCSYYVRLKTITVLSTLLENDLIPNFIAMGIFNIVLHRLSDRTQLVRKKVLEFLNIALTKTPEINTVGKRGTLKSIDNIFEENLFSNLDFDELIELFSAAEDNHLIVDFLKSGEPKKLPENFKSRFENFRNALLKSFIDFGQYCFTADNSELEIGINILFRFLKPNIPDFEKICQLLSFTYENVKIDKNVQKLNVIFLKEIAIYFKKFNYEISVVKNLLLNLPSDLILSSYRTKNFIVKLEQWLPNFFSMECSSESRCPDCLDLSNLNTLIIFGSINYAITEDFIDFYHRNILYKSCDIESLKTHIVVYKHLLSITNIDFSKNEKINEIFRTVAEMNYIDLKIIDIIVNKIYWHSKEPEKLVLRFLEYIYKSKDELKIFHAVGLIAIRNSEYLLLNKNKTENIKIPVPSKYRERRLSLKEENVNNQEIEEEAVNEDLIFYVREHETFYGNSPISILYNKMRNYLHGNDLSNMTLYRTALISMFRCMAVSSEVFVENKQLLLNSLKNEEFDGKIALCDFLLLYNSFVEKNTLFLFHNMDLNLLLLIIAMAKTHIIKLHNFYADLFISCMNLTKDIKILSEIILENENIALTALYECLTKISFDESSVLLKKIIQFIVPILKERFKMQILIKLLEMSINKNILHMLFLELKLSEKSLKDLSLRENFNELVKEFNIKLN